MAQVQASFEEIQRRVQEALKGTLPSQVPAFARGVVEAPEKGWCKALYYDALTGAQFRFYDVPAVVAVALVREGPSRLVTAPTIRIPTVEVPAVPSIVVPPVEVPAMPAIRIPAIELPSVPYISVPEVTLPAAPTITVPTITVPTITVPSITLPTLPTIEIPDIDVIPLIQALEELQGWKYTCGAAFAWLCDQLNALLKLWDKAINYLKDVVIKTSNGIYYARKGILGTVESLKNFRDNSQKALNDYNVGTQKALNGYNVGIQTALNDFSANIKNSVDAGLKDFRMNLISVLNTFRSNVQASVSGAMEDYSGKVQAAFNSYQANIKTGVDTGLADLRGKTQVTIDKLRANVEDSMATTMADYASKVQAAFNSYRDNIEASVNAGLSQFIPSLYDMIGLPVPEVSEAGRKELMEQGDVNGDGVIDDRDIALIRGAMGKARGELGYVEAYDLNHDGIISIKDASIASAHYGKSIVPTTQLLSPAQVRNVMADGFEFYGLSAGMKLAYIAVGRRG